MTKTIGIDVGTSNSAAAAMIGGKATIIPSAEGTSLGGKAFPSYVAFTKDGQMLVGEPAKRQAVSNPEGTVISIKRKMGTDYRAKVHGKEYTPQQITAFILQKIKRDAEAFLGDKVDKAVLTVPAYFNDNQRTATKDAGAIAGLEVVRIINEPTAAALAYGIDKTEKEQKILVFDFGGGTLDVQKILVFDFGGGTLDVTTMEFSEGVFEVLSTSGDTELGGTDMDTAIVDYVAEEFKTQSGIDVRNDSMALQRLREASEKAKIELSNVLETDINLPFITADASGPKHLVMKLSRAKIEELVRPIVDKSKASIDMALKDAKLSSGDINKIIFVGGPTRMPIVQKFVEDHVGSKGERGVDPMECVAMGAAIQAGVLTGEVPSPRGVPQIDVTFDIDANGILSVTAKDLGTGKQQAITISASTKLAQSEIDRMVNESKRFEEEDKRRREAVETKNQAESLIYTTEKSLTDLGDKVTSDERTRINAIVERLKETIKSDDVHKIKTEMEELTRAFHEISTRAYQQAGGAGAQQQQYQQQAGGPKEGETGTADAEYKVVDEEE
jgi:molecular chaperone DnaK